MKLAALFLCIVGLALPVHGQDAPRQVPQSVRVDTTPPTATLVFTEMEISTISAVRANELTSVGSHAVAKNVQIQMGDNVLIADEAEIRYNASGNLDDVELRGNVHLRAKLDVKSKQ